MRSARWLLVGLAAGVLACSGSSGSEPDDSVQDLTPVLGQWDGEIVVGGVRIWFIVDCADLGGRLTCTLDYPDLGLENQPLTEVSFLVRPPALRVGDRPHRRRVGRRVAPRCHRGRLHRVGRVGHIPDEQAPRGPDRGKYSWTTSLREVKFASGDLTLAGTLTMPRHEGPHPAVVLLSGSGPQTRDYGPGVFPDVRGHSRSSDQQRHRRAPVRRSRRGLIDRRPARRHHRGSGRHHLGRARPAAGTTTRSTRAGSGWWATAREGRWRLWWPTGPSMSHSWYCWPGPP